MRQTGRNDEVGDLRPAHLPTPELISGWPDFNADNPLVMLVSGCIAGFACGADGSSYGAPFDHTQRLLRLPNVRAVTFCPEDFAFGTPREVPDVQGGDGFDVLDGRARVISSGGRDWTERMLAAAEEMLAHAQREHVRLALLMDISAACGSQVIYLGPRAHGVYQRGAGVCAAMLIRNGIPVMSQRDFRTFGWVMQKLDLSYEEQESMLDHHEGAWYRSQFG